MTLRPRSLLAARRNVAPPAVAVQPASPFVLSRCSRESVPSAICDPRPSIGHVLRLRVVGRRAVRSPLRSCWLHGDRQSKRVSTRRQHAVHNHALSNTTTCTCVFGHVAGVPLLHCISNRYPLRLHLPWRPHMHPRSRFRRRSPLPVRSHHHRRKLRLSLRRAHRWGHIRTPQTQRLSPAGTGGVFSFFLLLYLRIAR